MHRIAPQRVAQISIGVLFLALLRTLGEYYRLRGRLGREQGLRAFEPFIPGLAIAVAGAALAIALCFASRFRLVIWAVGMTLVGLLLYRFMMIP